MSCLLPLPLLLLAAVLPSEGMRHATSPETAGHEAAESSTAGGAASKVKPTTSVAVWTTNTGDCDSNLPYECKVLSQEVTDCTLKVDCFYITDNKAFGKKVAKLGWTVHNVPKVGAGANPKAAQRKLKILGSELDLAKYAFSIYHDANMMPYEGWWTDTVAGSLAFTLKQFEDPNMDLVIFEHPLRETVAEERAEVVRVNLCTEEQVQMNKELLEGHGFPDDRHLVEGSFFIKREPQSAKLKSGLARWFDTISTVDCFRDQLAFNFAMWQEKVKYVILPMRLRPLMQTTALHADPKHVRILLEEEEEEVE